MSLSAEDVHLACDALEARIVRNRERLEMFSLTENAQLRWIGRKLREMSEGKPGEDPYRPGLVAAGVLHAIATRDSSCREVLTIQTIGLLRDVIETLRRIAHEPPAPPALNRHARRAMRGSASPRRLH